MEAILARNRETRWLPFSAGLLLMCFGFACAGVAMGYLGAVEGMFILAMLPVMLGLLLVGWHSRKTAAAKAQAHAMRLYMSATAGGVTTTVYPDRIEQRSSRVAQTVFFTETAVFTEHTDWLLLEDGGAWVALAATDVTPWEAQSVYEMIAAAIPPARQFTRGDFVARRVQPSPPPFSTTPPVCYERVEYREEGKRGFVWPAGILSWLLAAAFGGCGMLTVLFAVTSFFFLDYLIFFAACFGGGLLLTATVLFFTLREPSGDVVLSFTSEGLRIEREGRQQFVAAADVHARRTENGMKLFTPAGVFAVPWARIKNRQQMEWMLFSQRPSSF
ncbi:MAG: hypothetical protein J6S41_05005 [Clostridia bacterium]|nr:hypothetical protein [Clostridia bacterium]